MISTPQSREKLLLELVRIPSITSGARENDAAVFIFERLRGLDYFKKNPSHLTMIPTPLEGDENRPLNTVAARMMADIPTKKTVVFIAHYDVVDTGTYGNLAKYAFEPAELAKKMADESPCEASEDLRSGNYIFGRGVMDMKCGLAIELELLRDYDHDRSLFDVNIIVLSVPDEENTSCGMRGSVSYLADLKRSEGLEYLAGINTEPGEPGLSDSVNQLVFLGTLGKLLPAFYCMGIESHVGNYYKGLSAALLSAQIICAAEADPQLADSMHGVCQPSWICLENRILSEGYSVTVPRRSITYFNCFVTGKSPADILSEMRTIAEAACDRTVKTLAKSHSSLSRMGYGPKMNALGNIKVISFSEIRDIAARVFQGGESALENHISEILRGSSETDARKRGLLVLEELIRIGGISAPFVAIGFLPPYIPSKTSLDGKPASEALLSAIDDTVAEARDKFGVVVKLAEFFSGLCDLSYLGFSGDLENVMSFADNCPAADLIFRMPFADMAEIDMPVANFSTSGRDAHKKTERLERDYSLRILPELIVFAVNALSRKSKKYQPFRNPHCEIS
jgi:arginine utilization protein RocB